MSPVLNDEWIVAFTHSKKLISGQRTWKHLLQAQLKNHNQSPHKYTPVMNRVETVHVFSGDGHFMNSVKH